MIGGNSDGNGDVDMNDKDVNWTNEAGNAGYYGSDLNLDTQVNNPDKNDIWDENNGTSTAATLSCGVILDDRDWQIYTTVLIGDQCWMAENLNIGTLLIGSTVPTNNGLIEKYCYDDLLANCDTYGGFYEWNEMMQYTSIPGVQGICPSGWHIPTDSELTVLSNYLGGESIAGGKLKEAGTMHWSSPNTGATNESGFTALPAGWRYFDNTFHNLSLDAYYWTSTEYDNNRAWMRYLGHIVAYILPVYDFKEYYSLSTRCLKD